MRRTYKDAINALNSLQLNFASLEAKRQIGPSVDKNEYSIKVVYEYIRRLGYTPSDFNKLNVIHVTGTKGKGSTCAFTESILLQHKAEQNLKVGLFTSPHLKSVRERIRIDGKPINELLFTRYFFEVWDKLSSTTSDLNEYPDLDPCDKVKPMYFKYLTILSFHIFLSEGVNTAIYEVGVGGKYDSTNIVPKPTVTGISALGIDHTAMLGNTIESIAWNKTGIFKPGSPAFVSIQREYPDIKHYIEKRASELGASSLEFVSSDKLTNVSLGLQGDFQKDNASLAIKLAAAHLSHLGVKDLPASDFLYLPTKFVTGLTEAKWDGRCQVIQDKPGFEDITWFIDGAHTMESINVCTEWLATKKQFTESGERKKVLLFNQQGRENANDLLARVYDNLKGKVEFDVAVFTTNITWASGYNAELVSMNNSQAAIDALLVQKGFAEIWEAKSGNKQVKVFKEIEAGINYIKQLGPSDVAVVGSLHLVGGVLSVLDGDRD